jgi:hypothetical protein
VTVSASDPVREAKGLRQLTWGERVPVDPVQIAHRLGMKVVDAVLDQSIPVALVKEVGMDPVIMLNAKDNVNRKRFSCAYAIGACIQADPEGPYVIILRRDIFSTRGSGFPSAFALALLTDPKRCLDRDGKLWRAIRYDIPVETLAS